MSRGSIGPSSKLTGLLTLELLGNVGPLDPDGSLDPVMRAQLAAAPAARAEPRGKRPAIARPPLGRPVDVDHAVNALVFHTPTCKRVSSSQITRFAERPERRGAEVFRHAVADPRVVAHAADEGIARRA